MFIFIIVAKVSICIFKQSKYWKEVPIVKKFFFVYSYLLCFVFLLKVLVAIEPERERDREWETCIHREGGKRKRLTECDREREREGKRKLLCHQLTWKSKMNTVGIWKKIFEKRINSSSASILLLKNLSFRS